MGKSGIEWTDFTWNPITGCSPMSPGCNNCYAKKLALDYQKMGLKKYKNGFLPTMHEKELNNPILKRKKSSMIFVCSMGDIFHKDVKPSFLEKIFKKMNECTQHTFQLLTKREFVLEFERIQNLNWTDNIWMGATVENLDNLYRIDCLKNSPAKIKFISFEPLIEDIGEIDLEGIDWVIVGGESGKNRREMKEKWVVSLRDQCKKNKIPFFFKGWGDKKNKSNNLLQGQTYKEFPLLQGQTYKEFHQNETSISEISYKNEYEKNILDTLNEMNKNAAKYFDKIKHSPNSLLNENEINLIILTNSMLRRISSSIDDGGNQ